MPAPATPVGAIGTPTGQVRFRRNMLGKLILQCEVKRYVGDIAMGKEPLLWIDAPEWALYHIRYYRKLHKMEPFL
jgi:hypothetical protein